MVELFNLVSGKKPLPDLTVELLEDQALRVVDSRLGGSTPIDVRLDIDAALRHVGPVHKITVLPRIDGGIVVDEYSSPISRAELRAYEDFKTSEVLQAEKALADTEETLKNEFPSEQSKPAGLAKISEQEKLITACRKFRQIIREGNTIRTWLSRALRYTGRLAPSSFSDAVQNVNELLASETTGYAGMPYYRPERVGVYVTLRTSRPWANNVSKYLYNTFFCDKIAKGRPLADMDFTEKAPRRALSPDGVVLPLDPQSEDLMVMYVTRQSRTPPPPEVRAWVRLIQSHNLMVGKKSPSFVKLDKRLAERWSYPGSKRVIPKGKKTGPDPVPELQNAEFRGQFYRLTKISSLGDEVDPVVFLPQNNDWGYSLPLSTVIDHHESILCRDHSRILARLADYTDSLREQLSTLGHTVGEPPEEVAWLLKAEQPVFEAQSLPVSLEAPPAVTQPRVEPSPTVMEAVEPTPEVTAPEPTPEPSTSKVVVPVAGVTVQKLTAGQETDLRVALQLTVAGESGTLPTLPKWAVRAVLRDANCIPRIADGSISKENWATAVPVSGSSPGTQAPRAARTSTNAEGAAAWVALKSRFNGIALLEQPVTRAEKAFKREWESLRSKYPGNPSIGKPRATVAVQPRVERSRDRRGRSRTRTENQYVTMDELRMVLGRFAYGGRFGGM